MPDQAAGRLRCPVDTNTACPPEPFPAREVAVAFRNEEDSPKRLRLFRYDQLDLTPVRSPNAKVYSVISNVGSDGQTSALSRRTRRSDGV